MSLRAGNRWCISPIGGGSRGQAGNTTGKVIRKGMLEAAILFPNEVGKQRDDAGDVNDI